MMKALLLYDSVDENVKKVALAISRGLESGDMIVDSFSIEKINVDKLDDYDVIGIGGHSCSNGISMQMKEFLKSIEHIKMKGKIGFAYEAKSDFKPVSSAARIIYDYFKQIKVKLIHPPIAGMLIGANGSLLNKRLDEMEHIGLEISERVNKAFKKDIKRSIRVRNQYIFKYLSLIIFGGGAAFFLARATQLASNGGDTFANINPITSWILLSAEIGFSGLTSSIVLAMILFEIRYKKDLIFFKQIRSQDLILFFGVSSYVLHFVRVTIWLSLIL